MNDTSIRSILLKTARKLYALGASRFPDCIEQDEFSGQVFHAPRIGLLYFAIPKAANTSLKWMMFDLIRPDLPAWVTERVDSSHMVQPMVQDSEVLCYLRDQGFVLSKSQATDIERKVAFSVVRDPVDRIVSCWRDKIGPSDKTNDRWEAGVHRGFLRYGDMFRGGMGLEAFCDAVAKIPNCQANPHFRDQVDFVEMSDGRRLVDCIFALDDMASGISKLIEDLGIPAIDLPKRNRFAKWNAEDRCSDASRRAIEARYYRDYGAFGFKVRQPMVPAGVEAKIIKTD